MEYQALDRTIETIPGNSQIDNGSDQSSLPLLNNDSNSTVDNLNHVSSTIDDIYQAKRTTPNYFKFALEVFRILRTTVGYTVISSLLLVLPIIMIAIGAKFEKQCPIQPMIPKFLIIGGSFLVLKLSLAIRQQGQESNISQENHYHFDCYVITDQIISAFLFIWFLLGNIWVFSHANNNAVWQSNEPSKQSPCNIVLYRFSFDLVISVYIFYLLLIVITIVISFYAAITFYRRKIDI